MEDHAKITSKLTVSWFHVVKRRLTSKQKGVGFIQCAGDCQYWRWIGLPDEGSWRRWRQTWRTSDWLTK